MNTRILTGSFLALVTAMPVLAQGTGGLEEVVVTAQRREQNLQDIPVSVTAFTGEAIAAGNIKSATDYLSLTPNVSFTEDGQQGSRGMGISVRGVNNLVTGENAFTNSIGNYLDEFSIGSVPNQVANPFLPDMERIEVLRGPQGTLFGRNSLGGAINVITHSPTDQLGGKIILGGEDYENAGEQFNVTAIGNAPLTDTLKARAVVYYEDSSGLVKNVNPAGNDSDHQYVDARLKAVWDVTPDTSVTGTFIYSHQDQGADENVPSGVWDLDTVDTFGVGQPGALPTPANPRDENGNPIGFWRDGNQNKMSHDLDESNKLETFVAIVNVQHQLNDNMRIKWISGVVDATQKRLFDNDLVGDLDLISRTNKYDGISWSTELRLEASGNHMDWVIGGLYAEDQQKQHNNVAISTNPTAAFDVDGNPATPGDAFGFLPPFPFGLGLALNSKKFEVQQMAMFGDITWHLSDDLDIIAGGRFTADHVTNHLESFGIAPSCDFSSLACFDPASGPGPLFFPSFVNFPRPVAEGDDDFTDFAPRLAGHLKVTDDLAIYAVLSKGYKNGGVSVGNNTNNNNVPLVVPFKKETLWNYELGFKSELFDNRVRWNTSIFHTEWSDLQLEAFRFLTPGDLSSNFEGVVSVGSADATGIETEFEWAATDQLTFSGSLGYIDTEITSPEIAQLSGGVFVNLQGLDVPKSPPLTASLSGEYRWPMLTGEAWIRLEFIHRDGQYSDVEALTWEQHHAVPGGLVTAGGGIIPNTGSFPYKTPDYDLLNLRAGFDWNDWGFNFYIQNLTDEEYYTGTQENFGISGIRLRPHPRFFGGSVSYSFGGI
jgi:iron complex outermembrane receptor protein